MPFAYPDTMNWLPFMAASPPGTMIWLPLKNAETDETFFSFVIREESRFIKNLPKMKTGGVPFLVRSGLMPIELPSGKQIPMLIVMVKLPGGISEMTINALHLDDETLPLIREPKVFLFVGDSGRVERTLLFPANKDMAELFELSRQIYEHEPWVDREFDQAKAIYEASTDMDALWKQMGES